VGITDQRSKGCILFSFEIENERRVKAWPPAVSWPEAPARQAFTPAVILFIALPAAGDKSDPG
jgi:hypothetical protein